MTKFRIINEKALYNFGLTFGEVNELSVYPGQWVRDAEELITKIAEKEFTSEEQIIAACKKIIEEDG